MAPVDIVFFSLPLYTGNARSLYEYIVEKGLAERYGLRLAWVARGAEEASRLRSLVAGEAEVIDVRSVWGLYRLARARLIVADNYLSSCHRLRSPLVARLLGEKILFTWHGIPFRSGRPCPGFDRLVARLVATSMWTAHLLSARHMVNLDKVVVTGYPRNDRLFRSDAKKLLCRLLEGKRGVSFEDCMSMRHVIYAPTYRHVLNPSVLSRKHGVQPESLDVKPLNMSLDELRRLDTLLEKEGAYLHIRYHFYEEPRARLEQSYYEKLRNIAPLSIPVTREADPYDYLGAFDMMITDYSSIFYDYLLLDRPIIFYPFDYGRPIKLIIDLEEYDTFVPGPVAIKPDELIEAIRDALQGGDVRAERRRELRRLVHRYIDARSSERVWMVIREVIGV